MTAASAKRSAATTCRADVDSPDLGGVLDAIRIGSNRFWLEKDGVALDRGGTGYRSGEHRAECAQGQFGRTGQSGSGDILRHKVLRDARVTASGQTICSLAMISDGGFGPNMSIWWATGPACSTDAIRYGNGFG